MRGEAQAANSLSTSQAGWDLPLRLFHGLLIALFAFSWWSGKTRNMDWHRRSGLIILTLLLFRLLWGCFGSSLARFSNFVRGPRRVLTYIKSELFVRNRLVLPGHNPAGGWSVLALLGSLTLQVILGLFAVDLDGLESGPLSSWVSFDVGRLAAKAHGLLFEVLLWLIGLHVAAVLFYLIYKRANLIRPMFLGVQAASSNGAEPSYLVRALSIFAVSAVLTLIIVLSGRV